MINEYRTTRQDAIAEFMKPIQDAVTHALGDAFLVTALTLVLIGALACVIYGVRSGVFHVALLCVIAGALLCIACIQALLAFPFTWGSAGLGFLMIVAVMLRGYPFALRLLRVMNP